MKNEKDLSSKYSPGSSRYFEPDFDLRKAAQEVFQYQSKHCQIYHKFLQVFGWDFQRRPDLNEIPFLPIEAFKFHRIQTGHWAPQHLFLSSGTQGGERSQHLVQDLDAYLLHTQKLFSRKFGALKDFVVLALLPNYLEVGDSSLVTMVSGFMRASGQTEELFFLHDLSALREHLDRYARGDKKILLFGVTFALLDFATKYPGALPIDTIIIETGGMKGRGKELDRTELHNYLATQFAVPQIYSEYGMTELMSQVYCQSDGRYQPHHSFGVRIRELTDPLAEAPAGKLGIIQVIDLANINTCSFIATGDLGIRHDDGSFEVIGRLDEADIRGCHLLYL